LRSDSLKKNENYQLFHTLEPYRKKNPAGFEKLVGNLLKGGLEATFERLEGSCKTPHEIRTSASPTPEEKAKLVAFYALIQARNILRWDEKEQKGITQLDNEDDDSQILDREEECPDDEVPPDWVDGSYEDKE
jgi:hypothetical protein